MTPAPASRSAMATLALFVFLMALGLGMAWYSLPGRPVSSTEAVVRAGVGNDLLSGLTRGRQGLVGSLYWSPLPTLVALPFLRAVAPYNPPCAFVITAIAAAALLGVILNAWFRRNGVPAGFRFAAVLVLFCSPAFRLGMAQGDTDLLFVMLAITSLCFLMSWWETEQLRSLGYLAVTLMLAMITRYQTALLFVAAAGFVAVHLYARRHRPHYAEATLTIFLVPPLYAAGLWLVANWLIMGDPLFFLRGLAGAFQSRMDVADLLVGGCDWKLFGFTALVAVLPWLVSRPLSRRRRLWAGLPVVLACALIWTGSERDRVALPSLADHELENEVVPFINVAHRGDWVAVSGYRGYEIVQWMPERGKQRLYHTLSLYPDQTLTSTRGRRLYLLVPEPTGRDRWEDVNLTCPGIFDHENAFTVHERTWQHWRLLRVVRMDQTDRR